MNSVGWSSSGGAREWATRFVLSQGARGSRFPVNISGLPTIHELVWFVIKTILSLLNTFPARASQTRRRCALTYVRGRVPMLHLLMLFSKLLFCTPKALSRLRLTHLSVSRDHESSPYRLCHAGTNPR